jgi:hypothetical protein
MSMGNEQYSSAEEEAFANATGFDAAETAQETETQAPAPAAATDEPFEGFSQLPESARAKFTETMERAQKFEQELAQQRRQYGALSARVPALQRQFDEYKKRTAAAPSSAPNAQMTAEAWEAYKAAFPDEAKAVAEYQAKMAAEIGGKLDPLASELKELKEWREQVQAQMQEAESEQIQDYLDDVVPDWRIIAGWETPDGKPGNQEWHPEFQAWLESMPERKRGQYQELLGSRDPDDIASAIGDFKRDYYLALLEEESAAPQQQAQRPRLAATRDVMPSATSNGLGSYGRNDAKSDDERAYLEATTGELMQRFRAIKTG